MTILTHITGEAIHEKIYGPVEAEIQIESFTLDLGGADGGTYDIGIAGTLQTVAFNVSAPDLQIALETVYGAGFILVGDVGDPAVRIISFPDAIIQSLLIADFTDLTNATDPELARLTEFLPVGRQGGLSPAIKARFKQLQVLNGITVPDTSDVLRSAQLGVVSKSL